jgi:hypothetical protein
MADLAAGEEERNPIFFALILQMISMTLIHVCCVAGAELNKS